MTPHDPQRSSAAASSYPWIHDIFANRMPPPLLTVVMPTYNAQRFIAESIESVIAQTVDDWELLVVDDASTDATKQVIAKYQEQDGRIRLLARPSNQGPAYARNFALDQARGKWIAFIDSDDIWHPQKTEKQLSAMHRHGADISYTGYRRRRDGDLEGAVVHVPKRVEYRTMLRRNLIACSTAIVRSTTCGSLRMPLIKRRQDHGLLARLTERRHTNRCRCHRTSCLVPAASRLAFGKQANRRHVLLEAAQRGGRVQYGQIPLAIHWLCSRGREAARALDEAMMHTPHSRSSHFPARLDRSSAIRSYQWRLRKNSPRALAPSQSRL